MIGAVWTIQWHNPHTDPPEGKPRVLAEWFFPNGHQHLRQCPPELQAMTTPGDGYRLCWSAVEALPKKQPKDKLALTRQKRLRRRMEKKYPLFAEMMVEAEMEKRPSFYAGETDQAIEDARDRAEAQQRQRLDRLLAEYKEREGKVKS